MKLCFSTLPCPELNFTQIAMLCKEYGISAIELRQINGEMPSDLEALTKNNIKISDIASSVCIKRWDENVLNALYSSIDSAALIDASAVRVFLGNFYSRKDEPRQQLDHSGIVKMLKAGCDYGACHNVKVWVETHNEYSTGDVLKTLINEVGSKQLGIIWDIMHPLEAFEEIFETYANIGKYIEHIHIKDGKPWDNPDMISWKYTPIGEGKVPINEIVSLLMANKYDGYYSLEWENAWRDELKQYPNDMNWILKGFVNNMNLKEQY